MYDMQITPKKKRKNRYKIDLNVQTSDLKWVTHNHNYQTQLRIKLLKKWYDRLLVQPLD